jgi:hypothetical protein
MAGKHKKKNAQGHVLFIVAWGDAYYIDDKGNIVDYNGVAVPKQLAEILKENHKANVIEDVEKAKSEPEPTPEKVEVETELPEEAGPGILRRAAGAVGETALAALFPSLYKGKKARGGKDAREIRENQSRRDVADLKLSITALKSSTDTNTSLIKQSLVQEQKINTTLNQILNALSAIKNGGGGINVDLPGINRGGSGPKGPPPAGPKGGKGKLGFLGMLGGLLAGGGVGYMMGSGGSVAEGAETEAIRRARSKGGDGRRVLDFMADKITYTSRLLKFNVDKLTLTVLGASSQQGGAAGGGLDSAPANESPGTGGTGGGTGGTGGGTGTTATPQGKFEEKTETPAFGETPAGKGAFKGFDGKPQTAESVAEDVKRAGSFQQSGYVGQGSGGERQYGSGGSQIDTILDTIMFKESRGQNVKNPTSSASGYFQFTNSTWKGAAAAAGIDVSQYPTAMSAPYDVQRAVARSHAEKFLKQANGDVSRIPVAWYTGNIRGQSNDVSAATVNSYAADWMKVFNGKQAASGAQPAPSNQAVPAATPPATAAAGGVKQVKASAVTPGDLGGMLSGATTASTGGLGAKATPAGTPALAPLPGGTAASVTAAMGPNMFQAPGQENMTPEQRAAYVEKASAEARSKAHLAGVAKLREEAAQQQAAREVAETEAAGGMPMMQKSGADAGEFHALEMGAAPVVPYGNKVGDVLAMKANIDAMQKKAMVQGSPDSVPSMPEESNAAIDRLIASGKAQTGSIAGRSAEMMENLSRTPDEYASGSTGSYGEVGGGPSQNSLLREPQGSSGVDAYLGTESGGKGAEEELCVDTKSPDVGDFNKFYPYLFKNNNNGAALPMSNS